MLQQLFKGQGNMLEKLHNLLDGRYPAKCFKNSKIAAKSHFK